MVDYKRVTILESVLQNGSCKFEVIGQNSGCYAFKEDIYLIPKEGQGSIPREIGSRFMRMLLKVIVESGCRVTMSSSNGGEGFCDPYFKISPESTPQHRFLLDSSRFDEHGVLEPVVKAYGVNLLHDLEPLLVQKVLFFFTTNLTNGFKSWKSVLNVDDSTVQINVELCLYDLRAIQTLKQNCRRAWVSERTMTRRMVREIETLVNGPKKYVKGVRWRPERKHPWVAELKVSKDKKVWIGDFDTAEGAAQAYETVAHQFKAAKERRAQQLAFSEDSMLRRIIQIAKTRKQSATYSAKQQQQQQTRSGVALHEVSTAAELKKGRDNSDVDIIGANYGVASSSSWSKSICNPETGITKSNDDDFMLTIMADEPFYVQGFSPSFDNLVSTPDFHDIAPSTSRKHVANERIQSGVEGEPLSLVEENVSGGYSTIEVLENVGEIQSATTRRYEELDPFCEWTNWIGPNNSTYFDFETWTDPLN